MDTKPRRTPRRADELTRAVIVQAAVDVLDEGGEEALTLRALTGRLKTGYGAVYHHVHDRDDLLGAAADHILAPMTTAAGPGSGPQGSLRAVAAGLFDVLVVHPWVGGQLNRDPWRPALLDIYELVGSQLLALGVADGELSDCAGVLVNYILGVAAQNAANAKVLTHRGTDRSAYLAEFGDRWERLDPARYPALHRAGREVRDHDDREQFLAGVDLILAGISALHPKVGGPAASAPG